MGRHIAPPVATDSNYGDAAAGQGHGADQLGQDVVKAIVDGARTGSIGDGKVWVLSVEQTLRIRTGEMGGDAL